MINDTKKKRDEKVKEWQRGGLDPITYNKIREKRKLMVRRTGYHVLNSTFCVGRVLSCMWELILRRHIKHENSFLKHYN